MISSWLALAWPGDAADLSERRRADAIVARVRAIALAFSGLTLAWIPVDLIVFPRSAWMPLTQARIGASVLLFALAHACRGEAHTRLAAWFRLATLFMIPVLFFASALLALHAVTPADGDMRVQAAYVFVPFVVAAGIGAFPLTLVESAALAAMPVGAQAWAMQSAYAPLEAWPALQSNWLLLLLVGVGTFAAASQMKLMSALVAQAIRDPLTGCHRRESGQELLEIQFRLSNRRNEPLTVLFADLDRFKRVNDEFGHEAGDRVLANAAAEMRAALRASDALLRWGGEEFVVLLPHTRQAEAVSLIERLRARGVGHAPDGRPITLSIGVAETMSDAVPDAMALIELADRRKYLAKQSGRNCYVLDGSGRSVPVFGHIGALAG